MPNAGLGILISAKDLTSGTLKGVTGGLDDVAKSATGPIKAFGDLAKTAALAGAGIAAAVGGIGIAAIKSAGEFEAGMREVNTLLGDTEAGFQALGAGVLDMSKAIGVDATAATKALYQAISAGVPKENAVEFLAVASKAAIGAFGQMEKIE